MHKQARLEYDLPERYANLYDYRQQKFETPLDAQGIADIDATFDLAIRTFPDKLPHFSNSERNVHHLYWTESFWKNYAQAHNEVDARTITKFRNGTPQLAYVPKLIHAWVEEIMLPPPPPPIEVMRRRNAAWSVAAILLESEKLLEKARGEYETKKDNVTYLHSYLPGLSPRSSYTGQGTLFAIRADKEYLFSELTKRLDGWRSISERVETVPEEDRIIPFARLVSVRALRKRIKNDAIVPLISDEFIAA